MKRVVVVGGGAAGIIAAWRAASLGAKVTLLEKKERLGLKILISGGGKCNLTHSGSMDEIRRAFRPNEGRFLLPAFYAFTNDNFLDLLRAKRFQVYARPDGRIFPIDQTAKEVVEILETYLRDVGVQVRIQTPVIDLLIAENQIVGLKLASGEMKPDRVIIASGGSSYPATGTTGDAWKWLAKCGHKIEKLCAALAPIYLINEKYQKWSGIALRNIVLKGRINNKEVSRWKGDLLFTHKGISGPAALGITRELAEKWSTGVPTVEVDILPSETFESLLQKIKDLIAKNLRKQADFLVENYLPERFTAPFLEEAGIVINSKLFELNKKQINKLVAALKGWQLGEIRHIPLERGEVVAGGVSLEEVDPKMMRSKLIKNLYICGEALDIAGPVGGYNLQAAWSTGYVAGENAAK